MNVPLLSLKCFDCSQTHSLKRQAYRTPQRNDPRLRDWRRSGHGLRLKCEIKKNS